MEAEEVACDILHYYRWRRGVGHTTATARGFCDMPSIVVCSTRHMAKYVRDIAAREAYIRGIPTLRSEFIVIQETPALRGTTKPLVLEHTALVELLSALIGPKPRGKKTVKAVV
jgi:hypothetical protein